MQESLELERYIRFMTEDERREMLLAVTQGRSPRYPAGRIEVWAQAEMCRLASVEMRLTKAMRQARM